MICCSVLSICLAIMPLELRQVTSANEVPEIVEEWVTSEAHLQQPLVSVPWRMDDITHKDRIMEISARHWFSHSTTPGDVWLKVVDSDLNNKVIAASRWTIKEHGTTSQEFLPARAYWLPPCPARRLMENIMNNFTAMRTDPPRLMPHMR